MPHNIYDNFYLSNEVEDQFNSHLDLNQFCTPDNSLVGTPGMVRKINVYTATDGTEKLAKGQGNNLSIEVDHTQREYTILMAQNRFTYFDEEEMTDPMLVPVGVRHMGTDMFNTVNGDIYGEFLKAPKTVVTTEFDFDCFADAQSLLNLENLEGVSIFAFVCASDVAEIRKKLKDSLQYVTEFAKSGYIGTVAGVNIYTKKDAVPGTICMGTREAVTVFNKKGTEIEQPPRDSADANIRKNTIFSRKYYLVALTDETKAVKIVKGTATLCTSTETTVDADTVYYERITNGFAVVTPETGDNPYSEGWYTVA